MSSTGMKAQDSITSAATPPGRVQGRTATPQETAWCDPPLNNYHDLGAGRSVGDSRRQIAELDGPPVAVLAWGPAGDALQDRDRWLGWSAPHGWNGSSS